MARKQVDAVTTETEQGVTTEQGITTEQDDCLITMARKQDVGKSEPIVSPSLIKEFDPCHPIPWKLRIGWEELTGVPINPAHYTTVRRSISRASMMA